MLNYLPDVVLFWLAVLGVILAVAFRAWNWSLYLIAPAVVRWFVWPMIAPMLSAAYARMPFWEMVLLLPLAGLVAIFALIKVMQGAIESIYGTHVSVRVTAHAIIAYFKIIGRVLGFIFMWPIRAFKNRKNMDDLLRQWRRP